MDQQNLPDEPEWLKNHNPPPGDGRGNPGWHKGMKSPNPSGRKPEFGVARTKITSMLMDNVGGILEKQIAKALEGDSGAATLVLSRVMAPLKADSERVRFHFDPALPISQQVEQVLAAIAAGAGAPDIGKQIIDAVAAPSNGRANTALLPASTKLEAKTI